MVDKTVNTPNDLKDTRLQLIDAKLQGLAPVTIDALQRANVPVERRDCEGVTHEFFGIAAVVDKAKRAQAFAGARLKAAFGTAP